VSFKLLHDKNPLIAFRVYNLQTFATRNSIKTTVFVDEGLIKQALRMTNLKTKKDVIEAGLRELVRKRNQELLQQELGSFDLDLSHLVHADSHFDLIADHSNLKVESLW
jgi:Arc/MetJ family transcription regulator